MVTFDSNESRLTIKGVNCDYAEIWLNENYYTALPIQEMTGFLAQSNIQIGDKVAIKYVTLTQETKEYVVTEGELQELGE